MNTIRELVSGLLSLFGLLLHDIHVANSHLFIDLLDLLLLLFCCLDSLHVGSDPDIRRILEPDGVVVVFHELALHPQDLDVIQLRNVIGHLVALFHTEHLFVFLDELFIITELAEIELDFAMRSVHINWSEEVNNEWSSTTNLCLDTGLDDVDSLPEVIVCSLLEDVHKSSLVENVGC